MYIYYIWLYKDKCIYFLINKYRVKQRVIKYERNNVGNRNKYSFEAKHKRDTERARTIGVIFCFFNLKQKPNDWQLSRYALILILKIGFSITYVFSWEYFELHFSTGLSY